MMSELDLSTYIASDKYLQKSYYEWLCDMININNSYYSYYILTKELAKKTFYSLVDNDDNRETDGKNLRKEFLSSENILDTGALDGPCSVLEMLIGLSMRMEKELYKLDGDTSFVKYYWILIQNLGLYDLNDENYVEKNGDIIFEMSMDKFLNRKYKKNGKGGLFPLKKSNKDQRTVEIWYQMQEYLKENFKI